MSRTEYAQANFGPGATGLGTVGYALYAPAGTLVAARTTTGVAERGAGTGNYGALVPVPDGGPWEIRWDTGDLVPATASAILDDPLAAAVPADFPWGSVGYILGHLLLGAIVMSTVADLPPEDLWITRGDDYGPSPAGQPRLSTTFAAGTLPDYTGGSASYTAPALSVTPLPGTLVAVGPTVDQTFALDLTHTASAILPRGDFPYALEATTVDGARATIRHGVIHVVDPVY